MKKWFIPTMLLSANLIVGCGKVDTSKKQSKPVKAQAVQVSSTSGGVRYSASIRANMQVDVAFKVGGYIQSIAQVRDMSGQTRYIQEGDILKKGTVLATVRQSDYQAKVNQAKSQQEEARTAFETSKAQLVEVQSGVEASRSQLAEAQAAFDRASLEFERAKTLFANQSLTKTDYDAAKAQFEVAQARLNTAKAQFRG
ncbi:MAG: hypothetical protein H0W99_07940, partial [Acidobacteria bacterium]|nr:hypothetical protein [Acidobacteriota bacterium]